MKKHLCLICTVMSVVLTTLLSGCNDGNLSETSSALTFSESTSSIFINSDNTSSEIKTSSKTSSTQKEETSSSNSTSTTSKNLVDRTQSSQISSNISSEDVSSNSSVKDINEPPVPIMTILGFPVYDSNVNVSTFLTKTYSEEELNENSNQNSRFKDIKALNECFPIENIKKDSDDIYRITYRGKLKGCDCFYFFFCNKKGNIISRILHVSVVKKKRDFNTLSIGDTLKDVMNIQPLGSAPETWTYPLDGNTLYFMNSYHYTTDGFKITFCYEIPEEDKTFWKEVDEKLSFPPDTNVIEYLKRWIIKEIKYELI